MCTALWQVKSLWPEPVLLVCIQEDLKCKHFLWQLFHIDQDLSKARQRMSKEDKALQAAARSAILADKEFEAKKKEHAGIHLDRIKLDRHLKRRRADTDQKVNIGVTGSLTYASSVANLFLPQGGSAPVLLLVCRFKSCCEAL